MNTLQVFSKGNRKLIHALHAFLESSRSRTFPSSCFSSELFSYKRKPFVNISKLILSFYTHHTDSFQGEESGPDVEYETLSSTNQTSAADGRQIIEDVVEDDPDTDEGDDVSQLRERSQELEVADVADQNQRNQQKQHMNSHVQRGPVLVCHLKSLIRIKS